MCKYVRKFLVSVKVKILNFFNRFVTEQDTIPVSGLNNPNTFSPHRNKITVNNASPDNEEDPANLPVAHVCFYSLDLPDYNNYGVLKRKMMQAISNTSSFEVA